jgi:hypothetical protein
VSAVIQEPVCPPFGYPPTIPRGISEEGVVVGSFSVCTVGLLDFLMLLGVWGPCPEPCHPACTGDINCDCTVSIIDFLKLLANWG